MQLIAILVVAVSALAILSGVAIFAGSSERERASAAWFLVATLGAAIWGVTISAFLNLSSTSGEMAPKLVAGIFTGSVLMDIALLGYSSWGQKIGKVLTVLFALIGVTLVGVLFIYPELLYSSITLSSTANTIHFLNDWYFWSYGGFIMAITGVFSTFLMRQIVRTKNKKIRRGQVLFLGGLSLSGLLALVFDLLLPIFAGRCDLLWAGPLSIAIAVITFYYTILHYRVLSMKSHWLKTLSFVILIISAVIVYLVIFFALFSALFRTTAPSIEVVTLNLLMAVIVLLLLPTFLELYASAKSLISLQQIDVAHIIRRLDRVDKKHDSLKDIAGFLADHLHFTYVGFLVNGRLHSSSPMAFSTDELAAIAKMKTPARGIWQDPDEKILRAMNELDVNMIAALYDKKGERFGQIILGRPVGKSKYDRKELIQLEMIINLVGTVVS